MMTGKIVEALDRLKQDYPLTHTLNAEMIHFTVEGIDEDFRASALGDECVLSTKAWHEHFSDPEELEAFLRSLFIGKVEIIVTYRGIKAVSHRVQVIGEEKTDVVSRTCSLVFPFWKKSSQKKMEYRIANKAV
jgi:hypothetical protein